MSLSSPDCVASPAGGLSPAGLPILSVVVPCHNEAESLDRLASELAKLRAALRGKYAVELVLVDDGSRDATWTILWDLFGDEPGTRLVRHEHNRGIAAAIRTGIEEASGPLVASLDADCTYDAEQVVALVDLMTDGVDLVVASPYHPRGKVVGVSPWRLALSKSASQMYRAVMRNKLHTYTSCVRVYRKSAVVPLPPTRAGFVGIVELVWQLDCRGSRIVECPAVLSVRTTGQSKMRVARTALAHLRLISAAAWQRLTDWSGPRRKPAMQLSTVSSSGLSSHTL
jgi:dolichol-phosphate mannosyltransferase